jgi:uncharacterized membrane protein
MEFSNKGRRAIVLSAVLLLVPFSLYIPLQILFGLADWMAGIIMLLFTFAGAGLFDLMLNRVLRTECPQCPLKWEDYTASQREWQLTRQKQLWSGAKPLICLVIFCVLVFGGVWGIKLVLDVIKSAPQNVQFWSALLSPFVGSFVGIIYGNYFCNRRQKHLSELMNVPEQDPIPGASPSQQTNLPPIPSPFQ